MFLALLAATIATAARSAFAGAVAAALYYWVAMFGLETLLPARLQPLLPGWHATVLRALAFPEFAAGPVQPSTVQMGYRILTINTEQELPAMVGFQLPPGGPEPSLVLSLAVFGAYLVLMIGVLHVLWHRQEAP
ncbi:MAG TPA: hypothetical protein VLK32_04120 [Bacillota bacterium]|nr:hypothetical protein [Bacillota bacterium]